MRNLLTAAAIISLVPILGIAVACDRDGGAVTAEGRMSFQKEATERLQRVDARLRGLQEDGLELQGGNYQRVVQSTLDGIRAERDRIARAINNLTAVQSASEWKETRKQVERSLTEVENRLNNLRLVGS